MAMAVALLGSLTAAGSVALAVDSPAPVFAAVECPPAEGEAPPAGCEPPADCETPPAEGEAPPAGCEPPADCETPPAEGEAPPAGCEPPADCDPATPAADDPLCPLTPPGEDAEPDEQPQATTTQPEAQASKQSDTPAYFDTAAPIAMPQTRPAVRARPALLSPFPIVRIRGRLTRTGAAINLLSVRAPRGSRVSVRCVGPGCPPRTIARTAGVIRFQGVRRHLRAGARLEIRVTKAGTVGKYTRFTIRKGKAPLRTDMCLAAGGERPVRCPST
jgi:hypothetical protein